MSVDDRADHYAILGLDPSAPRHAIEGAVQRLSREADLLAYTSPQRSRALWAQIRRIRRDLLGDDARRQAYDRTLLRPVVQSRGRRSGRAMLAALLAAAVILVLTALATGSLTTRPTAHLERHGAALVLSTAGATRGNGYLSGETVRLRWAGRHGSSIYRLQIATSSSPSRKLTVFNHPLRTVLTDRPDYALKVVGAQVYHWRVQAYVAGRWTRYTAPQHFAVDRPTIGIPRPLLPLDGNVLNGSRVHLCWSPIAGETGYRLRIDRVGARRTTGVCDRLTLHPGTYRWSVAALVRGSHLYTGAYSSSVHFTIVRVVRIARRTTRRPATVQIAARRGAHHHRKTREIALAPARPTPRPLTVRHVSTSRRASSGTTIRRARHRVRRSSHRAGRTRRRPRRTVQHTAVRRATHRIRKRRRHAHHASIKRSSRRRAPTRTALLPPPPPPVPVVASRPVPAGVSTQPATPVPLVLYVPPPAPVSRPTAVPAPASASRPAVVPAPVPSTPLYVVPSPVPAAPVPVVRAAQVPVQVAPTPVSQIVVSAHPGHAPHAHPPHPSHP